MLHGLGLWGEGHCWSLQQLDHLTALRICHSSIEQADAAHLGHCTTLRRLRLDRCRLVASAAGAAGSMDFLRDLFQLTVLDLSRTSLPAVISIPPELRLLDLSFLPLTAVADRQRRHLAASLTPGHKLEVLGLRRKSHKPWSSPADQAELATIRAACPGADGDGLLVLTAATDVLPLDEEDEQLRRYMPRSFSAA